MVQTSDRLALSAPSFEQGCEQLLRQWQQSEAETEWEDVKVLKEFDIVYLQITRRIYPDRAGRLDLDSVGEHDKGDELNESDTEALTRDAPTPASQPLIQYDVVYSPTYQVPVVYITVRQSLDNKAVPSLDHTLTLLVPQLYRSQVRAVGVMGALSVTDHPRSGSPAFFVHPCRTAEAMRAVTAERNIEPYEYLYLWIGLVGAGVGLSVPFSLAAGRGDESVPAK